MMSSLEISIGKFIVLQNDLMPEFIKTRILNKKVLNTLQSSSHSNSDCLTDNEK